MDGNLFVAQIFIDYISLDFGNTVSKEKFPTLNMYALESHN